MQFEPRCPSLSLALSPCPRREVFLRLSTLDPLDSLDFSRFLFLLLAFSSWLLLVPRLGRDDFVVRSALLRCVAPEIAAMPATIFVLATTLLGVGSLSAWREQERARSLPDGFVVLDPADYDHLLRLDDNVSQLEWAQASVPFFDIDDADLREVYYFRWMSYRQHIFE